MSEVTVEQLVAQFSPGETMFIPGSSAEPGVFLDALAEAQADLPALDFVTSFVPGINNKPLAGLRDDWRETGFFPRGGELLRSGRARFLPLSYYGAMNYLAESSFDWAVAHVSPPNAEGNCSLGVAAEFMPVVIPRAKRLIAVVNESMPYLKNAPQYSIQQFDYTLRGDWPLVTYDMGAVDAESSQIAEHLVELIEDNSVLQVGLGKVPGKLLSNLKSYPNLKFHSGMLSDTFLELADQGCLDENFAHTTCVSLGSTAFYQRLPELDYFHIQGVQQTHAPTTLANYDNLVAVNSGLEVDLLGQANLEMLGLKQVSSVGGAADFARAARNANAGKSIIALPATAGKGKFSRIVPRLKSGQVTSLGRCDIDYVVTEYGIAELKSADMLAKAKALIAIAAPEFQEELEKEWQQSLTQF